MQDVSSEYETQLLNRITIHRQLMIEEKAVEETEEKTTTTEKHTHKHSHDEKEEHEHEHDGEHHD